ncbi:hypothetical protein SARC_12135 [Sphaeroforma arctica JP610]|uniref:Uncharacterized protein n=1 Tax=Sphaeroforma arctica JP610 TaxID=667725 RepID=A0A0L0FEY3_9EUKA|nr:hypothetical protein SARC_12135 [Sphaeroforma arctica JP610]KNC75339.1 hypothetical protein SARC_12135 [Sphaeroforma arctica JP610]|eukprot:XP_014149241.1 hypothetical protein SARC_12135 [Sphaeroforma arctica JP610]
MLPMVANTLEDEDAMDRISDLMRITGDALESKSFQRNAAAGVRFSKTTLEDDRIGEALSSGMEVLSSVLARPEISTAINTAGSSFNSAISHPSLQTGVKRVMESPRVNRAVNTTVKSSVSVAQQLMKNEQLSTVTRTGMDYGTRMLNDANVQQAVKRTVSNGAYYTKRVLDNETLGAAANTSTNVALSILGSGVVTGAANSTWELARGVVTSDQVVKSWGVLASTFEYFTAIPERSVEEMEQDLQVMKDIAEPEIAELQELEAKLAAEEIILRAKYDSLKSEIRGVRSKQVNIATRIKVAEAQLEVARNRLLDLEADDEQTTSTTAGTLDDQLERS